MFKKFYLLLFISLSVNATQPLNISQKSCIKVSSNINKITKTLRAGYSVSTGEKLKIRLQQLKKQRIHCQTKGFAISK